MNIFDSGRELKNEEVAAICQNLNLALPDSSKITIGDLRKHIKKLTIKSKSKIIMVGNFKGGIGKTANAFVISTVSAFLGLKTLVIDMDPQSNLSTLFTEPNKTFNETRGTIAEFFYEGGNISLSEVTSVLDDNLDIIFGTETLSAIEEALAPAMSGKATNRFINLLNSKDIITEEEYWLPNALAEMKEKYDLIIIDTRPALSRVTRSVMMGIDHLVVPINTDFLSSKAIPQSLEKFKKSLELNGRDFDESMFSILVCDPHKTENIEKYVPYLEKIQSMVIPEYVGNTKLLSYQPEEDSFKTPVWSSLSYSDEDFLSLLRLGRKTLERVGAMHCMNQPEGEEANV